MLAAVSVLPLTAACRWTESQKGFTSLSCVNNGEVMPASTVSVSSDAAMVGTSLKSVWKHFLREEYQRVLVGDLDQVFLGSLPVRRDCQPLGQTCHRPPGSLQWIPDSVFGLSGNVERLSGRPRRLRHEMRLRSDCGASALFSTHSRHMLT